MTEERAREIIHKLLYHENHGVSAFDRVEALQIASRALEPANPFLDALRSLLPIGHPLR